MINVSYYHGSENQQYGMNTWIRFNVNEMQLKIFVQKKVLSAVMCRAVGKIIMHADVEK